MFGLFLIIYAFLVFIRVGAAMVMIGVLHHDVIPQIPAFGFWHVFLIMITVDLFTTDWASHAKSSDD